MTGMSGVPATEAGFAALSEQHRRELHVHCYRMLASFDEITTFGPELLPAFGLAPTL
jgi:hypothetical protein